VIHMVICNQNQIIMKTNQTISEFSLRKSALIAGIGILLMAVLAPIANFAILDTLILHGDAQGTYINIIKSESQFRMAIFFFMLVAILDILVAWALYMFLKPINSNLSLLAAWFRIIYATLLVAVLLYLVNILQLISGAGTTVSPESEQLQSQVLHLLEQFNRGWDLSMIVFGFHLLIIGYLIFRAGYMKRILGILLILASIGYLIDGFGQILSPEYHGTIALYTFIGELVLIFWLLIKGGKVES